MEKNMQYYKFQTNLMSIKPNIKMIKGTYIMSCTQLVYYYFFLGLGWATFFMVQVGFQACGFSPGQAQGLQEISTGSKFGPFGPRKYHLRLLWALKRQPGSHWATQKPWPTDQNLGRVLAQHSPTFFNCVIHQEKSHISFLFCILFFNWRAKELYNGF